MEKNKLWYEKRKYPRINTSNQGNWKITVRGFKGKPLEGKIINLSMGGVAFVSHWRDIARALERLFTEAEIHSPDGSSISASISLIRIQPKQSSDDCICALKLEELNDKSSMTLERLVQRFSSN